MQYINKTVSFYVFLQKIGFDVDYWMPIPELNNYKISISGKIKNICTNNLLKSEYGKENRNPRVTLGSKGRFYLFTLVIKTFCQNCDIEKVFFLNTNHQDIRLCNLSSLDNSFVKINSFPDYYINPFGKIFSIKNNKFIQSCKDKKGRSCVWLYNTNKKDYSSTCVHQLVAKTFLKNPYPEKYLWVKHKDGNLENNHFSNLEWTSVGDFSPVIKEKLYLLRRKIDDKDLILINKMFNVGISARKIASVFEVSVDTILDALNR